MIEAMSEATNVRSLLAAQRRGNSNTRSSLPLFAPSPRSLPIIIDNTAKHDKNIPAVPPDTDICARRYELFFDGFEPNFDSKQ